MEICHDQEEVMNSDRARGKGVEPKARDCGSDIHLRSIRSIAERGKDDMAAQQHVKQFMHGLAHWLVPQGKGVEQLPAVVFHKKLIECEDHAFVLDEEAADPAAKSLAIFARLSKTQHLGKDLHGALVGPVFGDAVKQQATGEGEFMYLSRHLIDPLQSLLHGGLVGVGIQCGKQKCGSGEGHDGGLLRHEHLAGEIDGSVLLSGARELAGLIEKNSESD